ncbi:MAG: organic solvent tolerance ABC transporter substrate-binding protein [Candidatus Rokuibacteriota bacterium]|nr:MAG: organic solvent tolerance ABC transporter substrate-binding protein [Candidatus Rokubacteria bacterium]
MTGLVSASHYRELRRAQGNDQHNGSYALESSDLAAKPRRLRGVRGVLRAGRTDLPLLWQRRVRSAPSPAGGAHSEHDEQQLMRLRRSRVLVVGLTLAVLTAPRAWAGAPADQLFSRIDQVLKVLGDQDLKAPAKAAERRETLRRLAFEVFDFEELAKRCLARHWEARTPAERSESVQLLADLLERSYVGRMEAYSGERVVLLSDSVDGDLAVVKTRIITKQGTEVPVDYRMLQRGDRWRVYDVTIEGVSLVANYRSQFDRILRTSSFQQLVNQVREKR